MRTKYYIEVDGIRHEIPKRCIKNWDAIKSAYKRAEYDGITRSFTSQFEFVNEAYDILLALYLQNGFNATAHLSIFTITDRWEWEERFTAPIDFSSISWDNYVLKVNCLDMGLAALIKANKGIQYEFKVGSDMIPDSIFLFDRIPMLESLTYEFTQGEQYDDCADLLVHVDKGEHPFIGNVGDEICINRVIDWNDDQTSDADSFLFKALQDITVMLDYDLSWRVDAGTVATTVGVYVKRNGVDVLDAVTDPSNSRVPTSLAVVGPRELEYVGTFNNPGELTSAYPHPTNGNWAIIAGKVWYAEYDGMSYHWVNSGKTKEERFTESESGRRILSLTTGDIVYINTNDYSTKFRIVKSKFMFSWKNRGNKVELPVLTPSNVGRTIIRQISGDGILTDINISDYDNRLKNTYIIPSEVARGVNEPKFYSSFNDFVDWMSTVFGYVYYIGPVIAPKYNHLKICGGYDTEERIYKQGTYYGEINTDNIIYNTQVSCFTYKDPVTEDRYYHWIGSSDYNLPDLSPRTDTLFIITQISETTKFYFDEYSGETLYPKYIDFDVNDIGKNSQTVHFVHRSELFGNNNPTHKIKHAREINYSISNTYLYAALEIGYEKKDYDGVNGRDEFNFFNSYVTGCAVTDRKISLKSKYRADCYGLEFAVQKRGAETTDNEADQDVFFVLAKYNGNKLIPDRTLPIEGTLTSEVFNGAFSPIECIKANAGILGLQSPEITLQFASCAGNGNIVIDGVPFDSDIIIDTPLMTCGSLSFSTDEITEPTNPNEIIEVESDGRIYRGYIEEATFCYANNETAKYKILVKDVIL